jgi:soluble lytic murein transglycosylase-like protein
MSQTSTRGRAEALTLSTVLARGGMILFAALLISGLSGVLSDGRPVPSAVAAPVPAGSADPVVEALRIELASTRGALAVVQVESAFRPNVRSRAHAVGYTQLKLGTARHYEPWVTEKDLRTPDVNLRIGFRFLRDLVRQYGGDVNLALVAYNRGPARVNEYLSSGSNPDNGYGRKVLGERRAVRLPPPAPAPKSASESD